MADYNTTNSTFVCDFCQGHLLPDGYYLQGQDNETLFCSFKCGTLFKTQAHEINKLIWKATRK